MYIYILSHLSVYSLRVVHELCIYIYIYIYLTFLYTVHFGYSGHLGPGPSGHYIRMATISEVEGVGAWREVLVGECVCGGGGG